MGVRRLREKIQYDRSGRSILQEDTGYPCIDGIIPIEKDLRFGLIANIQFEQIYVQGIRKACLRGVSASNGVLGLLNTGSDADAVLVAARVGDASRGPDAVGTIDAVGASDEAVAVKHEVVVFVNGPAGPLAVARATDIVTGGVSDHALAHAGTVDIDFLGLLGTVEVEGSILDVERRETAVSALTGGVLLGEAGEDAAESSVEASVLDSVTRADGNKAKGLGAGGSSGSSDGQRGESGGRSELHFAKFEYDNESSGLTEIGCWIG